MPQDVVRDHLSRGAGGTCFSLTGTLLHFFRSLGFAAEPVLADRRYGESTHCALLVRIDGENRLIDPGYLIARPLALQRNAETRRATAFNELVFRPRDGGEKLDLFTVAGERQVYRLTYRTAPADESEFLRAWDASFDWDMMRYPLLTCVRRGRQLYLQGTRYQRRGRADVEREDLAPADLAARIAREFAIDGEIVSRALRILERRGESHGGAVPS